MNRYREHNLSRFVRLMEKAECHPLLQRKDDVWGGQKRKEFVKSAVNGRADNPIILVDVGGCLEHCNDLLKREDLGGYKEDELEKSVKEYEKCLEKGHKLLILEGGNRTSTIKGFYESEIFLDAGTEIRNSSGELIKKLEEESGYDKLLLDPSIKGHLDNSTVLATITIDNATWPELESRFVSLNEGEPLEPMEKLWVKSTPVSDSIREIILGVPELSELYAGDPTFKPERRGEALITASAARIFEQTHSTANGKPNLGAICTTNNKFQDVKGLWARSRTPLSPEAVEKTRRFVDLLCELDFVNRVSASQLPKWLVNSMIYACIDLVNQDINIPPKHSRHLVDAIVEAAEQAHRESKERFCEDVAQAKRDGIEPPKESSYPHHSSSNMTVGAARSVWLGALLPLLKEKMGALGIGEGYEPTVPARPVSVAKKAA